MQILKRNEANLLWIIWVISGRVCAFVYCTSVFCCSLDQKLPKCWYINEQAVGPINNIQKGSETPFSGFLGLFFFKASIKKKQKTLTPPRGTEQKWALMPAQSHCKKKRNFRFASVFIWILFYDFHFKSNAFFLCLSLPVLCVPSVSWKHF